jgi:hypothetical protein
MKILRKSPSKDIITLLFEMSLRSSGGCNISVGDKRYSVHTNIHGEYIIDEFVSEYELTEEEFKKLIK